ncbi:GTP-binding protein [Candidatus Woesearchaeota archaeon CG11_big_fil_rev_8_21_14_0_20_43_8]|nr:MAG: GTP-binding protein [Candidatus Woesearchaeota archaeon CG11_big_fil_rev_8_21_14_0_20_43_8]
MKLKKKEGDVAKKEKVKIPDRIQELEKELANTKYNKRTQMSIGLLKARIAKLREKQESRGKGSKGGDGYAVRKTGDGTVLLLGFPSVGKSTLLNQLTNANSEVGAYAFTTLTCIPGLLEYKHAKIQVLDVPGVVRGAARGTGRGKEVLSVMRNADLALIVVDVNHPAHLEILRKEVYDTNIRLDKQRPDVKITKTGKGGIRMGATCKLTKINSDTVKAICKEFSLVNADIVIREDITDDEFIDCIEDNKVYMPSIVAINKIDMVPEDKLAQIKKKVCPDICISAKEDIGMGELKDLIFDKLCLIRVFMKEPGKKADMGIPMIMHIGCMIKDVCDKLHKDFSRKFRFARVTGNSAKFAAQKLSINHVLMDGDVLELHIE